MEHSLDRYVALEVVRVTEAAAMAASRWIGKGESDAADAAAVDAMRAEMQRMPVHGRIVIGEGERDEAPMLYIGEMVGDPSGTAVDIAVDPLECTTICAHGAAGSLSVMAMAGEGKFLHAPDVYMEKIAVGPFYPQGTISLDRTLTENLTLVAQHKGCAVAELGISILDRPRHQALIKEARSLGVHVILIPDGDVAAVIHTTQADSGIDLYIGTGGAPEGVLAAAALRCLGGTIQGRLVFSTEEQKRRAKQMGIEDLNRIYATEDLAAGDVIFSATGVTDGRLVQGVKRTSTHITTHSILMRSKSGTVRTITSDYRIK
ncbi:MAG: class II fructose-bisphosphatase [Alphaproteobacteria bacterium]|nr:MAG: class II fructose-bisphosphatase [Alphaproteobacteria bacterium]